MDGTRVVFHVWVAVAIMLTALNAPIGFVLLAFGLAVLFFWILNT